MPDDARSDASMHLVSRVHAFFFFRFSRQPAVSVEHGGADIRQPCTDRTLFEGTFWRSMRGWFETMHMLGEKHLAPLCLCHMIPMFLFVKALFGLD